MKVTDWRSVCLCAIALVIVICNSTPAQTRPAAESGSSAQPGADAATYVIRPNDVLEIFVWKEPELSRKSVVRPDGRISFPLLQDVDAAGLTPEALKKVIEDHLKDYINSTNVTVMVDSVTGYVIYVVGKVQRPGSVTADKPVTVLQALTLAGGFLEYAKDSEISIIRSTPKGNETYRFDYKSVVRGKTPAQNIFLKPGDVVVVP